MTPEHSITRPLGEATSGWVSSNASTSDDVPAVEPDRLVSAADAILRAWAMGPRGAVLLWRDESQPARTGYTAEELIEAMVFLKKVGLLQPSSAEEVGGP